MAGRITITDLFGAKKQKRKLVAVSCYDYTTACMVEKAGVDIILVGDSAAQVILGHDSTLPAQMDFMVAITAAVRRAAPTSCLMADMPFLSYHLSNAQAIENAGRFVVEAGAQLVKIEATRANLDTIKAVSDAGIGVTAHIGIRPQSVVKLGRLRAEGTTADLAYDMISLADEMVRAGANSLLIEGTAREVAALITERVSVPVISCGSGVDCDGQILIITDILGISQNRSPKFAKSYADIQTPTIEALSGFAEEVRCGEFPDDDHCYHIKEGQLDKLRTMMRTLP